MEKEIFEEVKGVIIATLQLDVDSADVASIDASSGLMGDRPEFDSMAIVQLLTALEEFYDFIVDDDEIEAEIFVTFGSVSDFVEHKLAL